MSEVNEQKQIKLEEKHLIEIYKNKDELPKKIRIDASTICQLNCVLCYMRKNPEQVKNGCKLGFLSFENFKNLVDDNDFTEIELSNSGEIFLNPELINIIEYAHHKRIKLTATNGVNLNTLSDEMAEALVIYQFERLHISIDGASQESYSKYRVNGNYDQVIENIKKILYYKQKHNSPRPFLIWKFILFGHNEHEIIKAKEEAKKLGMDLIFDINWDPSFSPVINKDFVSKETGISYFDNYSIKLISDCKKDPNHWFYCKMLWEQPQINWDGQLLGCCSLYNNNFGCNVFEDGFFNAMNNPKLIYAKNILTRNALPSPDVPCGNCWCFEDMKKNDFWLKSPRVKIRRIIL